MTRMTKLNFRFGLGTVKQFSSKQDPGQTKAPHSHRGPGLNPATEHSGFKNSKLLFKLNRCAPVAAIVRGVQAGCRSKPNLESAKRGTYMNRKLIGWRTK
jgi:hypothetical protein